MVTADESRSDESAGRASPALRFAAVSKRFGSLLANDAVTLEVAPGEVHALLGENGAGKTTLMRIAAGLLRPDGGHLELHGERVEFHGPEDALEAGIGMVHQHFTLVPTLTAAENVALRPAALPRRSHLRRVAAETEELAAGLGFELDPGRVVAEATIAERQRLEIVKLLYRGAEIVIFDEPSAALTPAEWEELAKLMRRLAAEGKAVILISHKLDEVFSVAERFTVLRDGAVTGSGRLDEVEHDHLVQLMVGREVKLRPDRVRVPTGEPVLALRGLSVDAERHGERYAALRDVSFEVRAGEIVGVAGVAGNGQQELVEALTGLRPASGEIELDGEVFAQRSPAAFARRGGAYIPEDRHRDAVAEHMTVWENVMMRDLTSAPFSVRGILRQGRARHGARASLMDEYDVRAASDTLPLHQLSGGNQQKVVVARELSRQPRLVVASSRRTGSTCAPPSSSTSSSTAQARGRRRAPDLDGPRRGARPLRPHHGPRRRPHARHLEAAGASAEAVGGLMVATGEAAGERAAPRTCPMSASSPASSRPWRCSARCS